jgi:RNA polymerase sigma-70 factor, ECF subfamily
MDSITAVPPDKAVRADARAPIAAADEIATNFRRDLVACRQSLINVAAHIMNDSEAARDIVQDTYVTVLEKGNAFNGCSSLKTYLYRIVINKSIDARRRERRREVFGVFGRERAAQGCDPERDADNRDLVSKLLAEIPDTYRIPLVLAEVDGMSYEEIAETLRISMSAVRTRVFRCREKLRKVLEKNGWTS